jgi:hypothetical protein
VAAPQLFELDLLVRACSGGGSGFEANAFRCAGQLLLFASELLELVLQAGLLLSEGGYEGLFVAHVLAMLLRLAQKIAPALLEFFDLASPLVL